MDKNNIISEIRSFNRFYTGVLGLLNKHILDSSFSLTEVRVLLEIDRTENCTANILINKLDIDRGYISRIIRRFEEAGLVIKKSSDLDARKSYLSLTSSGKSTLEALEMKSEKQIEQLIRHLDDDSMSKLVDYMKFIKAALAPNEDSMTIRSFGEGDLSYIINSHKELYSKEYGFSSVFVDYVENGVRSFSKSLDKERENIWIAEWNGKPVGMIAIVKADKTTAQLRWFLIEPSMRGKGIGHKLMQTAIGFCRDKHYKNVLLWTVNILEAARHIYSAYGFTLSEQKVNNTWGRSLLEERWDLKL
ncbi:MAG: bifunctional helix-turn-helix transcriptional regulator/GNAT family N-acetyltransferase [Bacillota bacterium]